MNKWWWWWLCLKPISLKLPSHCYCRPVYCELCCYCQHHHRHHQHHDYLFIIAKVLWSIVAASMSLTLIPKQNNVVFNALHGMPGWTSYEKGVILSVCQTCDLWQNERNVCQHSYTTWKIIHPSFVIRRMVGGGRPLLPEILGQTDLVGAKMPIFYLFLLIAHQP